ncbi:conjugal transfer protein TrbL family protein [Virgibacillus siamensis]|uniref:conjugal transfer protein TrbL family protein n=1 Tax=Virgibacillus siamensis TaxID=480071 RepID=UPI0009854BC3|nr:conjugal transfer protein TrbL family protein [Virgibacillus siamensis]
MFDLTDNIYDFFYEVIKEVMGFIFDALSNIVFNHEGLTGFMEKLFPIFIAIGGSLMLCICLFKVIQYMIQTSARGGSVEVGLSEIIIRAVLASAMVAILPAALTFIILGIVAPLGSWMFGKIGDYSTGVIIDYLHRGSIGDMIGDGFVFLILLGFLLVAFIAFTIKMCIYHADIVLLELLSVIAAVTLCADDNNYMSVWWREVLSQITTILLQMALMVSIVQIITSDLTWWNFMLLIGFSVLLIRGPSVTRHMWYATGSSGALINGGKMATRMAMLKGRTR